LLQEQPVQKELKLTADQVDKLKKLSAKRQAKFAEAFGLAGDNLLKKIQELNDLDNKVLFETLQPNQEKRLKQIVLQQKGPDAFTDPEVATALALTDDQRREIARIDKDTVNELIRSLNEPTGDQGALQKQAEELEKKMNLMGKAANEKKLKLLTDKQIAKWKELQGEPFKGELQGLKKKPMSAPGRGR
jgi:hypothetical protein